MEEPKGRWRATAETPRSGALIEAEVRMPAHVFGEVRVVPYDCYMRSGVLMHFVTDEPMPGEMLRWRYLCPDDDIEGQQAF